jgi:DNA-binding PadR family transcriptional regulator
MPRENKTKYAILGLLSWRPMSGYDIRKVYEFSLGNFWTESYGQIYPILRQLEEEGLATRSTERAEGRPERNVYAITDAGRTTLQKWLAQPTEAHRFKVELLLKVLHGFQAPPSVIVDQISRFREEQEATLRRYADAAAELEKQRGGPFDHAVPYWLLTVRAGQLTSEAFLTWCDEALDTLRHIDAGTAREAAEEVRS